MRTSLVSLQTALYNRLSNDVSLNSKVKGVFEYVKKDQPFPYVSLGEDTVNDWSNKLEHGEEVTHTLHVWSQHKGKKETKEIMNVILESLTEPLLLDSGFFVDFSRVDFMEVLDDPDGITRHGIIRFRFKISQ